MRFTGKNKKHTKKLDALPTTTSNDFTIQGGCIRAWITSVQLSLSNACCCNRELLEIGRSRRRSSVKRQAPRMATDNGNKQG